MNKVDYLRISVTDRCDLNCTYCEAGDRIDYVSPDEILSFEEILQIIQSANKLGIDRIRLTGGEPLVREDLPTLVKMISKSSDTSDLSLTTNGTLLAPNVKELKKKGLNRVNVSLDTLDSERFQKLTGEDKLEQVLEGIRRAVEVGLTPVKINTVLMRNFNQEEIVKLVKFAHRENTIPRFIELMPIGNQNWEGEFLPVDQAILKLENESKLTPANFKKGNGPAKYYKTSTGLIGFISPLSHKFCSHCNRIRLTSQGNIRPCLAHDFHISLNKAFAKKLKPPKRKRKLKELIAKAIRSKPDGHPWHRGVKTRSEMSLLGG